ncbi:hypothetical protein SteCoe_1855 [Stentor coeruleus]|uniref:Uncharacterized protein n=1 Tax=Stentor coeruleus TaxID=5963 RepID=A0A1R2D0R1_9CILI|nr:hypothetical protein SteCoe_1855 [Stentor coeruleus]
MTEAYSLEDKISNIRSAIRTLTSDTYNKDHQSLLKAESELKNPDSRTLEAYLESRYQEEQSKTLSRNPFDNQQRCNYDFIRDEKNFSNTSFQGPHSNKIISSFTSDDIKDMSSFKINENRENTELTLLLEHERENIRKLEQRVIKKDEIIASMNARQATLTEEIMNLRKNYCDEEIEEYKSIISSLQEKLEKYTNQINYLQGQVQKNSMPPEIKKSQIDELVNRIGSLERQNAELLSNNNELSLFTNRLKQDQSLIIDLRYQLEKKDKQIYDLMQENKELAFRLNEANNAKKDPSQDYREYKMKEEIARLKHINLELTEKGTIRHRSRENERERSKSRKRSCSSNKTITDISNYLKCQGSDIIPRLHKLKRCEKLQIRLEQLLKDLAPQNIILSTKDIWKCIRKVIEEYLVIKKKLDGGDFARRIALLLGVSETDSYDEVKKICEERKNVNALMSKIKKMLSLSPHAALREVEDTIDEKV